MGRVDRVKIVGAFFTVMLLGGCATTPSSSALNVQDADERMVANCEMVGQVSGSSGWGNLAASTGMSNAQAEAREKAARLGATHIVWGAVEGGYSPHATGRAYKC